MNKETFLNLIKDNNEKIVFKFTATWCGPCKKAAPIINQNINNIPDDCNISFFEIDIDESMDVYGLLKTKRMIQGVPSLVYYNSENKTIWPSEAISSSKPEDINNFFNKIIND